MKTVKIIRNPNDKQTPGTLYVWGEESYSWACDSLELAWLDNKHDVSCIPTGIYRGEWTRSNRLSLLKGEDVYTYEIMNVPNRTGIRIHSANYASQLLGCIALGSEFVDLNKDGQLDLINSRDTVAKFNELMNKEDIELEITDTQDA